MPAGGGALRDRLCECAPPCGVRPGAPQSAPCRGLRSFVADWSENAEEENRDLFKKPMNGYMMSPFSPGETFCLKSFPRCF